MDFLMTPTGLGLVFGVVVLLVIIGALTRYRKCKSNEALVIYGQTWRKKDKDGKRSAKVIHGGAAFVLPVIQGCDVLNLDPITVQCNQDDALSKQNIRVRIPMNVMVAVSKNPEIMQNAAERILGYNSQKITDLVKDIVHGQLRGIIAKMDIEEFNSDRDKLKQSIQEEVEPELNKIGLSCININISNIDDEANYIVNLGKRAAARAENESQADIEEQEKLGAIRIAEQKREKETKVAETEKQKAITISETLKDKETQVAENDKERIIKTTETNNLKDIEVARSIANRESEVADAKATLEINKAKAQFRQEQESAQAENEKEASVAEIESQRVIRIANAEKLAQLGNNKAKEDVAKSEAELKIAQAEAAKKSGEAEVASLAEVEKKRQITQKEIEESRAKATEAALKASQLVPTEIAKEKAILEAETVSEKAKREAKGKAEATIELAKAEAESIRIKMEAEAQGQKAKLLAEAEGIKSKALAEAEGFEAMVKAAESNPAIAIQYKMVDRWEGIVEQQVKAVENIKLGNVTVYDGGTGAAGNFVDSLVKNLVPSLGVLNEMPLPNKIKEFLETGSEEVKNKKSVEGFEKIESKSKK